ncbi:MAG: phosphotransferase [Acidimicrobiales bacterium]|jgi:tRNA A-37 threonylcarbamoyl transferase component Bud32
MDSPGKLIASGRDADIFEYGKGSVLRRSRNGRSQVFEARVMEFAHSAGFPVPKVFEVSDDGFELVMERVSGPTMLETASKQPWKLRSFGRELAELHVSLHNLTAPDWMPDGPFSPGNRILHLDLHPLNVILANNGPVVIDWTNASRGNPMVDVAATWVLLASGSVPGGRLDAAKAKVGRGVLLRGFLRTFSKTDLHSVLSEVVEWKSKDTNMTPVEIQRMRSLL